MPYQGRLPYTYKSPYNTTLDQGTQTVPSLAFLGDTNNGLFSPATDNVAITTNGSEKLRVTSGGFVGIGTTNPSARLQVQGDIYLSGSIRSASDLQYSFNPLSWQLLGGGYITESNTTNGYIQIGEKYVFGFDVPTGGKINLQTNGSSFFTGGNVGIGTTNPSSKLHVYNGDLELTGGYNLTWGGTFSGGNPAIWGNASNKTIRFAPDGNTTGLVALLGASSSYILGNVGIGTTAPDVKFHVWAGQGKISARTKANTGTTLALSTTDASSRMELLFEHTASSYWRIQAVEQDVAYRPLVLQNDGGNVGIGITNPGFKLEVNGSFAATTKSFLIPHPTKENYKLRHGSLEGPENGVYVRGRTSTNIIELPDYWTGLVDEDSITVNLTPIGNRHIWVEEINNNKVYINSEDTIDCFYTVFAERKDVEKLIVEIEEN